MNPQALPSDSKPVSPFATAITIGFFAATVMWMLAWIFHMPGVRLPTGLAITIMLVALFVVCLGWLPGVQASSRIKVGALSGGIAGLINLLILGSLIVEQPETTQQLQAQPNQLQPNALLVIIGSLAISIVIGALAGVLMKSSKHPPIDVYRWRTRLGRVTTLTYLPLIAVGGIVTGTDSALAVPDGLTTYGAISVLFPFELMNAEPRIFFEHSHRLFGTLAGLTTLVLMISVLMGERRNRAKIMVVALFLAVVAQGLMGAFRVSDKSTFLAITHGVFAQVTFALAACTAISLSKRFVSCNPSEESLRLAKRTRLMVGIALTALFIQLVLGAVTRHLNSDHAMMTHAVFAFLVVMLLILAGSFCIRAGKSDQGCKGIRRYGAVIHGGVILQFTLGWAVLGLAWEGSNAPPLPQSDELATTAQTPVLPALITTTHHLVGALLFAATACAFFWALRIATRRKIR